MRKFLYIAILNLDRNFGLWVPESVALSLAGLGNLGCAMVEYG